MALSKVNLSKLFLMCLALQLLDIAEFVSGINSVPLSLPEIRAGGDIPVCSVERSRAGSSRVEVVGLLPREGHQHNCWCCVGDEARVNCCPRARTGDCHHFTS